MASVPLALAFISVPCGSMTIHVTISLMAEYHVNIRSGTAYNDLFYAAQLDRLGFVWAVRRGRKGKGQKLNYR